jgi:orotate phosphoribosyltransferase
MLDSDLVKEKKLLYEMVKSAYNFGDFKMKDGTSTTYYINGQVLTSDPIGLYLCSKIILNELYKLGAEGICGEVSGACPLVGSIITLSHLYGKPLYGYYIRKELKENGIYGYLDIPVKKDIKIVVVDDVLSSGKTAMRCKDILEHEGGHVIGFVGIIDRMRNAMEKLNNANLACKTIFTMDDFSEYIKEQVIINSYDEKWKVI